MALGYGVVTDPALRSAIASKGNISWPLRYDMKVASYQAIEKLND